MEPVTEKRVLLLRAEWVHHSESSCEVGQEESREMGDPCLSPGSDSVVAWAAGHCAPLDEGRQGARHSLQGQRQMVHRCPEVEEVNRPCALQRPQK